MKEYLLEQPVWFKPTQQILELKDKTLLITEGGSSWDTEVRIEKAPDNSQESGKVSVMAWQVFLVGDEEWSGGKAVETDATKYSEMHQWRRYLTQDALDLMRPRSSESLWISDFELVLPSETKSSGP